MDGSDKYRTSPVFWLGRLAFVSDGVSKPIADSRPKGPNFGWATLGRESCKLCPLCIALDLVVSFKLQLGIRARIQIWIRETACLIRSTLHLMGRWAAQTSRVRVSARSRSSLPLYPHFNRPSGFWPCVKSCLVGGSDKYHTETGRICPSWLGILSH